MAEAIYRGEGSVVRHWLRPPYSIDGWRLDVVHMLGRTAAPRNLNHLAGIYQAVKQENPQAYVLGEHFGDARRWLHAGVEDAAMNYMGFALPVRAFWRAGRGLSPGAAGRRRVRAVDGRLPRRAAARPPADPVQPVGQPRYRAFSRCCGERGAHADGSGVVAELDWRALSLLRR